MANKKIICTGCRRSYDNQIEYCPYCSEPNPLLKASNEIEKEESLSKAKPPKKVNPPKKNKPKPAEDEYDDEDLFEETSDEASEEPEEEYENEDSEDEYDDDISDSSEDSEDSADTEDDDDEESDDEEYADDDDEDDDADDEDEYEDDDEDDDEDDEGEVNSSLTADSKRSRIEWTDEEKKEKPDMSKAYDEDGGYNPNFDGYYNDTKAKIEGEIESLTAGKEKAILKVVLGFAAVIGVIVYLVLTLY